MNKLNSLTTKCVLQYLDVDQLQDLRHELNKNYVNVIFYDIYNKSNISIKTIYVPGELTELNIRIYYAISDPCFLSNNLLSYKISGMMSEFEAQRLRDDYKLGDQFQMKENSAETFIQENMDLVIKVFEFNMSRKLIFGYSFYYQMLNQIN